MREYTSIKLAIKPLNQVWCKSASQDTEVNRKSQYPLFFIFMKKSKKS